MFEFVSLVTCGLPYHHYFGVSPKNCPPSCGKSVNIVKVIYMIIEKTWEIQESCSDERVCSHINS